MDPEKNKEEKKVSLNAKSTRVFKPTKKLEEKPQEIDSLVHQNIDFNQNLENNVDYQFEQYAIDPNYYQYQMNTTVDTNPMAGIMPSIPNILYPQEYANMNVYNQNIGELPVSAEIIPQPTTEENIEGEGYYDKFGFFYFPDGSFIDPDGFKFDKNGFDASGGYYDENLVYVPAVQEAPKEVYVEPTQTFDPDANNEYYDEDDEDKYTKAYIEYVLEHKLIENLDYVQNSPNEYVYLMAGNMREGVTQQEITDYFNLNKIDTSQMTIAMNLKKSSTVARLEIYNKEVALSVLKLCGTKFKDSKLVIEVDEENERYYYGDAVESNEKDIDDILDDDPSRYEKYDNIQLNIKDL